LSVLVADAAVANSRWRPNLLFRSPRRYSVTQRCTPCPLRSGEISRGPALHPLCLVKTWTRTYWWWSPH